jgi:8-oxo-dGTP diphosphatase
MKNYVIGFAFTEDLNKVVLIRKNRPEWQAGKLNGVGGHLEERESWMAAMKREFEEETGVPNEKQHWQLISIMSDDEHYRLFVYAAKGDFALEADTKTDENIARYDVKDLLENALGNNPETIFNVPWLILMARQILSGRDQAPLYNIEH